MANNELKTLFAFVLPDWAFAVWLLGIVCLPLILWVLSGVTVSDKWMGAGDD